MALKLLVTLANYFIEAQDEEWRIPDDLD